ncbi:RHS repeat-associated core domain-containing protein, partial [Lysobacter sp. 2RAF19]
GGVLRYQHDSRKNKLHAYFYLGSRLVAIRETPIGASNHVVKYQHTDALGSPVKVTDANRALLEATEYEPYGKVLNRPIHDGPGFTGHVEDAATGLTHMQQRYYDPAIGRFLSVDPVTADGNTGGNFNRYKYAANNPYSFKDPDGRQECRSCEMSYGAAVGFMMRREDARMGCW